MIDGFGIIWACDMLSFERKIVVIDLSLTGSFVKVFLKVVCLFRITEQQLKMIMPLVRQTHFSLLWEITLKHFNVPFQSVTNFFIANLALADVIIGLFAIPFQFQAALLQRWNHLPDFLCPFCPFFQVLHQIGNYQN